MITHFKHVLTTGLHVSCLSAPSLAHASSTAANKNKPKLIYWELEQIHDEVCNGMGWATSGQWSQPKRGISKLKLRALRPTDSKK